MPYRLRKLKNGLINIRNNDNKCFPWFHIRHLNPLTTHPEIITKADRRTLVALIMIIINFLFLKKDYVKIKKKNILCINAFCYDGLFYPVHVSDKEFEDCMDLLLITDANKSHYVYIKDFNRFIVIRQKIIIKITFSGIVCSILVVKES